MFPFLYKNSAQRHSRGMTAYTTFSGALPLCLLPCPDLSVAAERTRRALERAGPGHLRPLYGARVLVKPNLLRATPLACTSPAVVAAACAWLLDQGARVTVLDSPGFGRAASVARAIGLGDSLRPLGLAVSGPGKAVSLRLDNGSCFGVSRRALESDLILSVPRVKAHSQMLLTLAVKNLFGLVAGMRKALAHTSEGQSPDGFANALAALWAALPPVAALADGIIAMQRTGPSGGIPHPLGLLASSPSAVALDEALCAVLGVEFRRTPLGAALERRHAPGCAAAGAIVRYTDARPEEVAVRDFALPAELTHTSFRPGRLLRSCLRRFWLGLRP